MVGSGEIFVAGAKFAVSELAMEDQLGGALECRVVSHWATHGGPWLCCCLLELVLT